MSKNLKFVLLVIFLWSHSSQALNIIQSVKIRNRANEKKIILISSQPIRWEKLTTINRAITLLKIYDSKFEPRYKEKLIQSLKKLPCKLNVVELMDNSILIAFKEQHPSRLKIRQLDGALGLEITILPDVSAEVYYRRGVRLIQKQCYNEALQVFHKALRMRPNYAAVYFQAGIARLKLRHLRKAKINFTKALKYDPNLKEAKRYLRQLTSEVPKQRPSQNKQSDATKLLSSNDDSVQVSSLLQIKKSGVSPLKISKVEHIEMADKTSTRGNFLNRTKLYFQLFLFFSILFIIIGSLVHWIIWKNRGNNSGAEEKNFQTRLQDYLQELQKPKQERDSAAITTMENNSIPEVSKKIVNEPQSSFDSFNSIYSNRLTATSVRAYAGDDLQQKIESYVGLGFSIEEIAQRLRIGKGEVQLRLGLRGKRVHMKAPEIRFEFDY